MWDAVPAARPSAGLIIVPLTLHSVDRLPPTRAAALCRWLRWRVARAAARSMLARSREICRLARSRDVRR
eukprot:scaffold60811_cov57-Phaeocystis_antarctica.AAC.1